MRPKDRRYRDIKDLYYGQSMRFPIIGAVLEGNAEGEIYFDDAARPNHIFVISKFGFCQEIYREYSESFFEKIKEIIEDENRKKLRLYCPCKNMKAFLQGKEYAKAAKRKRYILDDRVDIGEERNAFLVRKMTKADIYKQNFGLDLPCRYYRNQHNFIENAMPFVAVGSDNELLGIVYSAGNDRYNCEVDIFVKQKSRKKGVARQLVRAFVTECRINGKSAVWDCYADMEASWRLAEKTGFRLVSTYEYYHLEILK